MWETGRVELRNCIVRSRAKAEGGKAECVVKTELINCELYNHEGCFFLFFLACLTFMTTVVDSHIMRQEHQ